MTPVEILTPFKQGKRDKYVQIRSSYQALRSEGYPPGLAKENVAVRFGISISGVEYALRQTSK